MQPQFLPLDTIEPRLGSLIDRADDVETFLLRIGRGERPEESIAQTVTAERAHVLIIAEQDSEAVVALRVPGTYCAVEVFVEVGARLTVLCVQEAEHAAVITQRAQVADGGSVTWQNATLGADIEQETVTELVGPHASSTMDWLFYARGEERQRLSARNVFLAADGRGEITLQGVAEDRAHVRCNGLIAIGLGGGGTQTYLTESVLMLDATAKVDAIPGLEIKTNDVKASHSATASRVTEEDLFTFAARGIAAEEARRMYIRGFLGTIADRFADAGVREEVFESLGIRG